jgi:hypothetical protein
VLNLDRDLFSHPSDYDTIANHYSDLILLNQIVSISYVVIGEETPDFLFLSAPQMFEAPPMIVMVIAATRMHRNLVNFASKPSDWCEGFSLSSPSRSVQQMLF